MIGDRSSVAQLRLTRQMRQGQEEPDKYNTREKNFAAAYELGVPPNPPKSRVNCGQRQYSLRIQILHCGSWDITRSFGERLQFLGIRRFEHGRTPLAFNGQNRRHWRGVGRWCR